MKTSVPLRGSSPVVEGNPIVLNNVMNIVMKRCTKETEVRKKSQGSQNSKKTLAGPEEERMGKKIRLYHVVDSWRRI
jgi:hypothetical protein